MLQLNGGKINIENVAENCLCALQEQAKISVLLFICDVRYS